MKLLYQLSIALMTFGMLFALMSFLGRVPSRLAAIYNWGETNAYIIMASIFIIGLIMYTLNQPIIRGQRITNKN